MKANFLHFVGKSLSKSKAREMCNLMELSEKETRLFLDRYCSGFNNKTVEQCDEYYPVEQQKHITPDIVRKIRGWIQSNTGFFNLEELEGISKFGISNTYKEKINETN